MFISDLIVSFARSLACVEAEKSAEAARIVVTGSAITQLFGRRRSRKGSETALRGGSRPASRARLQSSSRGSQVGIPHFAISRSSSCARSHSLIDVRAPAMANWIKLDEHVSCGSSREFSPRLGCVPLCYGLRAAGQAILSRARESRRTEKREQKFQCRADTEAARVPVRVHSTS